MITGALIKWAIYGLIAIASVAAITLAWEHFVIAPAEARGAARQAAKDAPVIAQLEKALSDARAIAVATEAKYVASQQAAQAQAEETQHANQTRIDALNAQVAKLSSDRNIVLSNYARLVLVAASRTANAGRAAPAAAAGPATGTAAVPAAAGISERDLGEYASQAAAAYADAIGLFHSCRSFYLSLLPGGKP